MSDEVLFRSNLAELINTYNQEQKSGTPDFVLANFLIDCLKAYDSAVSRRDGLRQRCAPVPDQVQVQGLSKLNLGPGDRLMVTSPVALDQEARSRIRASLSDMFPGRQILVMEPGIKLSVLTETEVP